MSIIEIKDLHFAYKASDIYAINNLSLSVDKGEFVCILGHNGSGKSTLAKLIIGLLRADSGSIFINGTELTYDTVDELRKKIGIVFQNPDNQFVGVTVKDDIAFGLGNHQVPRDEMIERIDEYSKLVSMDKFLDHNPERLSGGEKQRVAIAGVLAMNPEIIIFDEATSMLDPKGVSEVNEVIDNLKGQKTIILITHNLKEALNADRVIVMNKGEITLNGTPEEVFKNKDVLIDSQLDILESMKILELLEVDGDFDNAQEIEELLWELTFKK